MLLERGRWCSLALDAPTHPSATVYRPRRACTSRATPAADEPYRPVLNR